MGANVERIKSRPDIVLESSKYSFFEHAKYTNELGEMGNGQSVDRSGTVDRRSISFTANPITNLEISVMVLIILVGISYYLYETRLSSRRTPHIVEGGWLNSNHQKRQIRPPS